MRTSKEYNRLPEALVAVEERVRAVVKILVATAKKCMKA